MKAIKIYTQDSKYFMEDFDNDVITELTEFVDDGKTLKLPDNSANRKYCAVKKAISGIKENELKEALKALDPDTLKALLKSLNA